MPESRPPPDLVAAQYEALPYPARDPAEERRRLVVGSPSALDEVVHYAWGGCLRAARPRRILVAGGGTGDGLVMLAAQLDAAGEAAELTYLDMSAAARRVAEARIAARGLTSVRFVTGSLLELERLGLGGFDYIDCCGVLHHLEAPEAGLAALAGALAPGGAIGLMLYGTHGRTGVYAMQELLRGLLAPEEPVPEKLRATRALLAQLPATNWLRRNPFVTDHLKGGDAGLYDLLLHARDRAYAVPEILALAAGAGLRVVTFMEPVRYDPLAYLSDGGLRKRVAAMAPDARWAAAELLAGNMQRHVLYLRPQDCPVAPPSPGEAEVVPVLREGNGAALAEALKPGAPLVVTLDGVRLSLPLPNLAPAILRRIDGRRSFAGIRAAIGAPAADAERYAGAVTALFAAFNGAGLLHLRRPD